MLEILLIFVLGWTAGTMVLKFRIRRALSSVRKDMDEGEELNLFLQLRTECHDGVIFVYNTATNMFVTQASTIDEVAERVKALDIKLSHVVHGADEFWVIDGKVRRNE